MGRPPVNTRHISTLPSFSKTLYSCSWKPTVETTHTWVRDRKSNDQHTIHTHMLHYMQSMIHTCTIFWLNLEMMWQHNVQCRSEQNRNKNLEHCGWKVHYLRQLSTVTVVREGARVTLSSDTVDKVVVNCSCLSNTSSLVNEMFTHCDGSTDENVRFPAVAV